MFQKLLVLQLRDLMVENGSRKGKNFPTPTPEIPSRTFLISSASDKKFYIK